MKQERMEELEASKKWTPEEVDEICRDEEIMKSADPLLIAAIGWLYVECKMPRS